MSIGLSGMAVLADRLELIQTIGRNIAGTSETPDAGDLKTKQTPAVPDDPTLDGFIRKDDRSNVSANSAGRDRAALLSSMMQPLRPPIAGPGQASRQAWNATLAQPLAELAQVDSAHSTSDLPMAVRLTFESGRGIPHREYSSLSDTLVIKVATDLSLATHTATDLSPPDLEGAWTAGARPENGHVEPAHQLKSTGEPPAALAQVGSAPSTSDLPMPIRLASETGETPHPEYSRLGDTLVMNVANDLSLATHTETNLSRPDLNGAWIASAEPDGSLVQVTFQFEDAVERQSDQPDAKMQASIIDAAKRDKAIAEAGRTARASRADGIEMAMISTGESASSALPTKTSDASVQANLILKALSELDLGFVAAGISPMATERAGVLASFVLNAHFLPGWPPARPIESPEAKVLVNTLSQDKNLSKSDLELLTYLANFGVSREHLEKLLKALKRAAKRPGLLRALVCFLTNLSATLRALGTEVDAIVTDLTLEEQLQVRHGSGNRRRIDLG